MQSLAGKLQRGRKADWILKATGTVAAAPATSRHRIIVAQRVRLYRGPANGRLANTRKMEKSFLQGGSVCSAGSAQDRDGGAFALDERPEGKLGATRGGKRVIAFCGETT